MAFCFKTPKWESWNSHKWDSRDFEGADLRLRWGLKQSCSPCQELSNVMSHLAYTQGNWVDSQLLMVRSQTANLTPGFSFDQNLCFRCPNGQQKLILDIYSSIAFQWYKELFKFMGFDPCTCALKIWESIWESNSQHGSSLGSVRVHSYTLFALPKAREMTHKSPYWPATLQPLTLVASPRLKLRHFWLGWQTLH
jgi:hypothetical protein